MKQKIYPIGLIILVLATALITSCKQNNSQNEIIEKSRSSEDILERIETPHPYPNGVSSREIIWSQELNPPDAQFIRLHFDSFNVDGKINTPDIYENIDYGPCETGESTPPESGVSTTTARRCGVKEVLKKFTPQEIFENNYVMGDFLLIMDKENKVIDLVTGWSPLANSGGWSMVYPPNIILLLYVDQSENNYGFYIDRISTSAVPQ